MKILILEDDQLKREEIKNVLARLIPDLELVEVENWLDYSKKISSTEFDLILLDLLVPRSSKDPKVEDHCSLLVETTRAYDSKSFLTPAIVLTRYLNDSEEFFQELNRVDINVISFDDEGSWRDALEIKVKSTKCKKKLDFIIVCALEKEMEAYNGVVNKYDALTTISGLLCREISIDKFKGAIVLLPRMGLVSAGIITTLAIEKFDPRLVCMSGICGGIPKSSKIYDLLITEICHQHDAGKWTDEGFRAEHYDNQVYPKIRNRLEELRIDPEVIRRVTDGISCNASEYPENMEKFCADIIIGPTSSGSAVMAAEGQTASLNENQRKLLGFDMEIYSVYEATRLSSSVPKFFAVKTVVDDGDKNKGDRFHRVGSLLSARFVVCAIKSGICDL